jgi:hypothetical protein
MPIKRFVREENGDIYDREHRRIITVRAEKQIGNHYYINPESEDEVVIHRDDIEERR